MTISLRSIVSGVVRCCELLAAVGVLTCIGLNLMQVVSRYFLNAPLSWSEEVMRYVMIWVAMLGAAAALGRADLPAINLLAGSQNAALKRSGAIVAGLAVVTFCVTLLVAGWPTLQRALRAVSPAAEIPLYYPYLAVFFGAGLIAILAVALLLLKQPIGGGGNDD